MYLSAKFVDNLVAHFKGISDDLSAVISNNDLTMSSSAVKMPTSSFVTHVLATAGAVNDTS